LLETQERTLFQEALKPPFGYQIDAIIGTTYSLDLLALLTIPLSLTIYDYQDQDGRLQLDPLKVFEAVRRHADKITLFSQAGQIQVPRRFRSVFTYIEESIVEVQAPNPDGVFHPKVWICRYKAETQPVCYKVIILSRNLTFDKSWDVMLVLDGVLKTRKNAFSLNHPLGNFVDCLPCLAVRPVSSSILERIDLIQYELRRVVFELPKPFEEIKFWPLGIPGHNHWPFAERMDRTLVVSPFLSGSFLHKIGQQGNKHILVTREESLAAIEPTDIAKFQSIYVLHDTSIPEITDTFEPLEHEEIDREQSSSNHYGLHAKLFVADNGWDAHVWMGSANATVHAFEKNVEFLVELQGKKSRCGIDKVLGRLEDKNSLLRLLREFAKDDVGIVTNENQEKLQLEKQLERVRRLIASSNFYVEVKKLKDTNEYTLILHCPGKAQLNLGNTMVRCWPISIQESFAAHHLSLTEDQQEISFGPVNDTGITSFFAFEAKLNGEICTEELRFLCNFKLIGAPADRKERVMLSIIHNRDDFLRFLLLLLADGHDVNPTIEDTFKKDSRSSVTSSAASLFPLFEVLLKSLHNHPEQLDTIAEIVSSLRKSEEGLRILPDGFLELWDQIWSVRMEGVH
jgi:hypothetical protein